MPTGKYKHKKRPPFSEEWKRNISLGKKGQHSSPKTEFKKGQVSFNKGKTFSKETRLKLSKAHLGYIMPERQKKKIGDALSGKFVSEETKQKIREAHICRPNRVFRDTSIELKIEAELKNREVNYKKQFPLFKVAVVDFYLPDYKIVIQCDGDYYHNLPGHKERDERQDEVLILNGFNVYRFWEHEINNSAKDCVNSIKIIKQGL